MKTQIFFLLICFSISSFADDIVGFNFGGEFVNFKNHKELTGDTLSPHEYEVSDVKFFDTAQVGTNEDKTIKSLIFTKEYSFTVHSLRTDRRTILEDFKKILNSIENRYGEFDKTNANNILGSPGESNMFYMGKVSENVANLNPKSASVGLVLLLLSGKENSGFMTGSTKTMTLTLAYLDKELSKKIESAVKDETSGF